AHDTAPPMFDRIMATGQDGLAEKAFQFVLDPVGDLHLHRSLFFYCLITGAAQQDAAAEVPEIIESFVEVEGPFERQSVDRRGDEHLAACRRDIELWEQLAREGVRRDEQLRSDEREILARMEQQVTIYFFIAGDLDIIEHGDAHRLDEAEEGLAELARVEL